MDRSTDDPGSSIVRYYCLKQRDRALLFGSAMSASSANVEPSSGHRRAVSSATPSRAQTTKTRPPSLPPTPVRASSSYSRPPSSSRPIEDVLPQRDYETSNVIQSSRHRSNDRVTPVRTESSRGAVTHQRTSSRSKGHDHHTADMPATTTPTNGAGHSSGTTHSGEHRETGAGSRSGRARAILSTRSGDWQLGKTIGAGSMGKVKLARRLQGGEQVNIVHHICMPFVL